jgi:hypothetical protein
MSEGQTQVQPQTHTVRIEVVSPGQSQPQLQEKAKLTVDEDSNTDYRFNPTYHKVAEFLGVDKYKREDNNLANKIAFVYDWAENKIGSKNSTEIMSFLHQTMRDLGVQFRGASLVNYLYQMTRLNLDSDRIRQKKQTKEMVNQAIAQKVKEVAPAFDKVDMEKQISAGITKVKQNVEKTVQREMSEAIKEGIQQAIRKAGAYGR